LLFRESVVVRGRLFSPFVSLFVLICSKSGLAFSASFVHDSAFLFIWRSPVFLDTPSLNCSLFSLLPVVGFLEVVGSRSYR